MKIRTLNFNEPEIVAGAIACSRGRLAVGTYRGYAIFSFPEFQLLRADHSVFGDSSRGVQPSRDGWILFGSDVGQNSDTPRDWRFSLMRLQSNAVRPSGRFPLGPGNWRMVKGIEGDRVVLWDATEDQGIKAVDLSVRREAWSLHREVNRVIAAERDELIGMGETLLLIEGATGQILAEHEYPMRETVRWTAAARLPDGILLGGHTVSREEYVFALWDTADGRVSRLASKPLAAVFSLEQRERATCDEEYCGADIFQVASIAVAGERAVIALGGDGEDIGACDGCCALGLLDLATFTFTHARVIDEHDGATGMLLVSDQSVILECCGSIYGIDLPAPPGGTPV